MEANVTNVTQQNRFLSVCFLATNPGTRARHMYRCTDVKMEIQDAAFSDCPTAFANHLAEVRPAVWSSVVPFGTADCSGPQCRLLSHLPKADIACPVLVHFQAPQTVNFLFLGPLRNHGCCWETSYMFAYSGLVVEIPT